MSRRSPSRRATVARRTREAVDRTKRARRMSSANAMSRARSQYHRFVDRCIDRNARASMKLAPRRDGIGCGRSTLARRC
jgi:hypothetical protein